MKIIEQKLVGKHTQDTCEDGIVVTDSFIAIIDGSTSKTTLRLDPDMKNGRYCMMLIANYIRHLCPNVTLSEFCEGITKEIFRLYPKEGAVQAIQPETRLCASAIIYSKAKNEIWMIGDCQCMVDGTLYENPKPYEARLAEKRASLFPTLSAQHQDMIEEKYIYHDYAREAIIGQLLESMQNENKTYAVIDGFPVFMKGIKIIKLDHREHDIVLASDGYPFLRSTLEKSEKKLAVQLQNDPYNIQSFKATKGLMKGNVSYDDRAYIRFTTAEPRRYFIRISFDGTHYHGWQIQPNGISVQEKLQQCLSTILRQTIEVIGAGRTDTGVHARTMVCHIDYTGKLDCKQTCFRLNRILPADISCNNIEEVSCDLHARFSATSRTYRYFIHIRKIPFSRYYSVEMTYPLNFETMNEAAAYLLSITDFKAFCKAGADNKTTLCHVTTAQWVEQDNGNWYFEITANRFLRNMVRAIVGTLIDVGRNRLSIDEFKNIVEHGSRSDSGESMPARGLFLWNITY